MNLLDDLPPLPAPTADRPLAGLAILLVEDSRLAAEGLRLLCARSGARLRRADTLLAAERHLRAFRPGAVIVDLHLPDGSGLDLIHSLAAARPRLDAILATSADPSLEGDALAAGADGLLPKPVPGLAAFQSALLARIPAHRQPPARRPLPSDGPAPDPQAFRDDLEHAAALLSVPGPRLDYVATFLRGVARSAGDRTLADAAEAAARAGTPGRLARVLSQRLARPAVPGGIRWDHVVPAKRAS